MPPSRGCSTWRDAIARAELVIAVRLVDVVESKIVHGGKQVEVTLQYRFEPVRTLKGIYVRDTLLLTDADLGIYRYGAGPERSIGARSPAAPWAGTGRAT